MGNSASANETQSDFSSNSTNYSSDLGDPESSSADTSGDLSNITDSGGSNINNADIVSPYDSTGPVDDSELDYGPPPGWGSDPEMNGCSSLDTSSGDSSAADTTNTAD